MYKGLSLIVLFVCSSLFLNAQTQTKKKDWEDVYLKNFQTKEKWIEFQLENDVTIDSIMLLKYGNHKWTPQEVIHNEKVEGKSSYKKNVFWNSGDNKIRLRYYIGDTIYYSQEQYYECNRGPITFEIDKESNLMKLSQFAEFSIWNHLGGIVMKSKGKEVDLSSLEPGVYYLLIDGRTDKFLIRN